MAQLATFMIGPTKSDWDKEIALREITTEINQILEQINENGIDVDWSQITDTPTTIAGYGITDAYTKDEVDDIIGALTFADIGGLIADAQVPESAVTQHEAALTIDWSQLTGVPPSFPTSLSSISGFGADGGFIRSNGSAWVRVSGVSFTDITFAGLTVGAVLRATSATTAAFGQLDLADTDAVTGLLPWANVNKTGSSLADLATRSAADLSSGVLADARVQASNVTQHQAVLSIAYTQLTGVVPTWNQNTTGSAATLTTTRTIWGQNFNGSANVSGALSGATTGAFSTSISSGGNAASPGVFVGNALNGAYMRLQKAGTDKWFTGIDPTATGTATWTLYNAATGHLTISVDPATELITTFGGLTVGGTLGASTASFSMPDGDATAVTLTSIGRTRLYFKSSEAGGKTWRLETAGSGNYGGAAGQLRLRNDSDGLDLVTLLPASQIRLDADLLFTDATYDIGKSGATRPRDGFFSRNLTVGGTGDFTSAITTQRVTTTQADGVGSVFRAQDASTYAAITFASVGGAISAYLGADKAGVLVTGTATGDLVWRADNKNIWLSVDAGTTSLVKWSPTTMLLVGDLKFADATYDIGKSAANRPRDLFLSRNATIGGTLSVVGNVAFNNQTPAAMPDYTVTNPTTNRALNVTGATLAQLTQVVGTMIADNIAIGLYQ